MSDVSELRLKVAEAIERVPVMEGTYSMAGEDAVALADAAIEATGVTTLQSTVSRLEFALVQAAVPLEALWTCVQIDKNFLAPTSRAEIENGVKCIREVLSKDIQSMKDGN